MPNTRKANGGDSTDLFNWRNDDITRQMSHNTELIEWDVHSAWFSASLANTNRMVIICEDESTKEKVAMVCFDVEGDRALMSINLSPKMRGRGKAKACLRDAISFFQEYFSFVRFIDAEIKRINIPSQQSFAGVGFVPVKGDADVLYYEYSV